VTTLALAAAILLVLLIGRVLRLQLVMSLRAPLAFIAVVSVVHGALEIFEAPATWQSPTAVALIMAVGYLTARFVLIVLFDWLFVQRMGVPMPRLLRDVVAVAVYLAMATLVLRFALNIEVGGLLATSAVLTVVIGLALQETLGTLLAGLTLTWERHLPVGSWVEVDGKVGRIEELGWRSMTLRTVLDEVIVVPNSTVARAQLRLLGDGTVPVAVAIRIGVSYKARPHEVKKVLLEVVRNSPRAVSHPAPRVLTIEYADSAIIYECRVWTRRPWSDRMLADTILTPAHAALARAGMEIPFPQRTLHIVPRRAPADNLDRRMSALDRCRLFADLPEDATAALAEHSGWLHFAPGEAVVVQGQASRAMYVIASGRVAVEREVTSATALSDAAFATVTELSSGEVFGEMAFLTGEPRAATVRAALATNVVKVDSAALTALLQDHPDLADELAGRMAARQTDLEAVHEPSDSHHQRQSLAKKIRYHLLKLVTG